MEHIFDHKVTVLILELVTENILMRQNQYLIIIIAKEIHGPHQII